MTQDLSDLDDSGPIDYLVVELPNEGMTGEAFPLLVDLVERGIVRILDLVVIRKELDGTLTGIKMDELPDGTLDLEVFDGARSGLLGDDDLGEAAKAVELGMTAAVLVYENVWAAPFATALRRSGAQLVASGRIPVQAVLAALDAAEQNR
ncbi:hypothetical protein C8K30_109252 [Promicromonospora sp. AC04]|uniref:DUF6325 family protein n=1 Tax=Promicromonospora sp. AC04 TaxID=2135723 RepID=UPI000D34F054|nr:DUF6325 family protein [Promicromonospora sp. AC04]PUB24500.1 hypothetical protein C8K30_109252 [Promicromonospora sp. AC04]